MKTIQTAYISVNLGKYHVLCLREWWMVVCLCAPPRLDIFRVAVHDLTNSRHVHDVIRKAVLALKPKNNLRGVVDSLTSILHAADEIDEAINYVHHQMSAQKNHGNILIYTIAREAHDEEDLRRLENIVDGVIALYKIYDGQGWKIALQIEKMRGIDFEPLLYHYCVKAGEISLTPFED